MKEKWSPHNWTKVDDVTELHPVARSRYLAYESPAASVGLAMLASRKRLHELSKLRAITAPKESKFYPDDKEKMTLVYGCLMNAEANDRVNTVKLKHYTDLEFEINAMVDNRPSALAAQRLRSMLYIAPPFGASPHFKRLTQNQQRRVESLIDDYREKLIRRSGPAA